MSESVLFEIGSHTVTYAGLEIRVIFLPQLPKCLDYKQEPPHPD